MFVLHFWLNKNQVLLNLCVFIIIFKYFEHLNSTKANPEAIVYILCFCVKSYTSFWILNRFFLHFEDDEFIFHNAKKKYSKIPSKRTSRDHKVYSLQWNFVIMDLDFTNKDFDMLTISFTKRDCTLSEAYLIKRHFRCK